jgi:AsmA protein
MKAVRYVIYALIALVLLAVIAVAVAVTVIDPNTYKPQIEKVVEDATNLELDLAGDIGWSFIPLGLELNSVEATLDGQRLVALEQMVAQVDFWSLIAMAPRVNTFVLDGLDARLEVDEQGNGNWTRIMPEPTTESADNKPAEPAQEPAQTADGSTPLDFNVDNVQISNARVHYSDRTTGQQVTLENFTLNAADITFGSAFPLDISFRVETSEPQLSVDGSISAQLSANQDLNEFTANSLQAAFDLAGEPFGGKTVTAEVSGSAAANTENETASLQGLTASLANLALTADLNVSGFGEQPQVSGSLDIQEFSLKELLDNLGMPAVETTDPDVLNALAFSTDIGGAGGKPELQSLKLTLDDTNFDGSGSYDLASGGIVFRLQGTSLNVDRYLPPAAEEGEATTDGEEEQTADSGSNGEAAPETDLLPLETLRTLLLDVDVGLKELIASNVTVTNLTTSFTAKDGLIRMDELSGDLYEGSFNKTATLDARQDNPQWKVTADVSGVQTLPLLTDLAEMTMLSGAANLDANVTTSGNRISALRDNARGEISFNLAEGEFRQMNLTRMACQGIALANQESLSTSDWGDSTPFNDMRGTLKIDGNTLNNTDLVAALAGMKLEGNGTVDMAESLLDYEIGLRVVGEIHRDEACRVTEYVENVVIPVECRGNFTEDPAGLCSFDGSRFRDTLKGIAANAAKEKLKEETDRAKKKVEEKAKEKLQKELGDEAGEKVKDALKGLFN